MPRRTASAEVIKQVTLIAADPFETARIVHETVRIFAIGDTRSSLLILRGPSDDVDTAERLARELDASTGGCSLNPAVFFIYPLKNASATELAAVLTASHQSGGLASPPDSLYPRFSVTPDPRTNSLLVGIDRPYERQLRDIIEILDRPLPELFGDPGELTQSGAPPAPRP
jgi:type II secretory pathway component GspD/PulD (secretin)